MRMILLPLLSVAVFAVLMFATRHRVWDESDDDDRRLW